MTKEKMLNGASPMSPHKEQMLVNKILKHPFRGWGQNMKQWNISNGEN